MQSIKHMAAFGGIILAAMTAPAAAQDCKPLRALASIKMKVENGSYLVPAKINKQDVFLALESAGVNGLYPEAVKALKLPRRDVGMKLITNSGGGSTMSAMLDELQLGQITFGEDRYFYELDGSNPNFETNRVAGTLDLKIVNDVDMDWDFGNNLFNLFSTDHCEGKVVYWKADVVSKVPFEFNSHGEIRVRATLEGKEFIALLDTGSNISVLNQSLATTSLGVDLNAPDVQKFGEGANTSYRKTFKSLELAGIAIGNPNVAIIPDRMKDRMAQSFTGSNIRDEDQRLPDLMIGMNVLRNLHIYVARKERMLYITPAAAAPAK